MREDITVGEITDIVEKASTNFERTNTEIKRKYLIWCIDIFKKVASRVSVHQGSFGTGYPFYALDSNLNGILPIISEQIRYNRQLVKDGKPFQKSIWECKSCLQRNYNQMPNLKTICKPCPKIANELKPRKIINRLPDIDMWLVCQDGQVEIAEKELSRLLDENNIYPSDINPIVSIEDVKRISAKLKKGEMPEIFLPIDAHIIEYSILKKLIQSVPKILKKSKEEETVPYLPIQPKSYRKHWQYDDEPYNYIYDFLTAFTEFNFENDLQKNLEESRKRIVATNTDDELFNLALKSATPANLRRFQNLHLEEYFRKRVQGWRNIVIEPILKKDNEEKEL